MTAVDRWLDELGPDYPQCHVALIDALRDYIRNDEVIARDLSREGSITKEQVIANMEHIDRCRALLKELEDWSFDPSLCGLLAGQQG